ncbi:hypothetical protein AB0C14_26100 [Microbispora hainanensis]|uniref:hypothetical protein n=1 Tax=Microbispora hainanensis TaxID=568844 RepID=UPI0033E06463
MPEWSSEPPEDWTDSEKRLWVAFLSGSELDLGGPNPVTISPGAHDWGPERTVQAATISHLLMGGPEQLPGKPARLILKGGRIEGQLDFGCAKVEAFHFIECIFDREPFLNDATVIFAGFTRCTIPGITAQRLKCAGPVWLQESRITGQINMEDGAIGGDLILRKSVIEVNGPGAAIDLDGIHISSDLDISAATVGGSLRLNAARIDGYLWMNGTNLNNPKGWALYGPQVEIGASMTAGSALHSTGGLFLDGARISGQLTLDRAEISHPLGMAISLDHARIGLGMSCDDSRIQGSIHLHHSVIGCQVSLERAQVRDAKGDAIRADHMEVEGSALFGELDATGPVNLHGAIIACNLSIAKASLSSSGRGAALEADGARVGNHFIARGCSTTGAMGLTAIQIAGEANFTDTKIDNGTTVALDLRRAVLNGSLTATGSFSTIGTIDLTDANIGVDLQLSDGTIRNPRERALAASGLRITGDLIADRCTIEGLVDLADSVIDGNLRLVDASIDGLSADESSRGSEVDTRGEWRGLSVRCTGSSIRGDLDLRGTRVTRELVLNSTTVGGAVRIEGTHLANEGPYALRAIGLRAETLAFKPATQLTNGISLAAAHVQELMDEKRSWPTTSIIDLAGFHYDRLTSNLPIAERLVWLKRATSAYSAGPYETLAACLDLAGQHGDARRVRLASIRRLHQSKNLAIRLWGTLQDATVGYGYAPTRALLIFIALFMTASLWFSLGAGDCSASIPGPCPIKANEHPAWDPWLYSLDLLIPLVDLGYEKAWDPAGFSKLVMVILVMSGWVLTTTVVAAAGRTLRRS